MRERGEPRMGPATPGWARLSYLAELGLAYKALRAEVAVYWFQAVMSAVLPLLWLAPFGNDEEVSLF